MVTNDHNMTGSENGENNSKSTLKQQTEQMVCLRGLQ